MLYPEEEQMFAEFLSQNIRKLAKITFFANTMVKSINIDRQKVESNSTSPSVGVDLFDQFRFIEKRLSPSKVFNLVIISIFAYDILLIDKPRFSITFPFRCF